MNCQRYGCGPSPKGPQKSVEYYDLICPITLALPVDPVTAEDGQVYERSAILQYFDSKAGSEKVKSPMGMTSDDMGKKLFPAPSHRKTIESLIESGVISGDLADEWTKMMHQRKELFDTFLRKAEQGDVAAMLKVGYCYDLGSNGCKKDDSLAFQWQQKAHIAGHLEGTARTGEALLKGLGAEQNVKKGACLLAFAAGKGSKLAAFLLGTAWALGKYGFDVDKYEASRLLEQSLAEGFDSTGFKLSKCGREEAKKLLDELSNHTGN